MPQRPFDAYALKDPGRVRSNNEDNAAVRHLTRPDGRRYCLLVVADGMGGGAKGEVASSIAVNAVGEFVVSGDWDDPAVALHTSAVIANDAVFRHGTGGGASPRSLMGTTLVAALVDAETLRAWIVNVGDSRAYILGDAGAIQVTRDHSVVAERVAMGDLTPEEARTARGRNVITRGIGTDSEVVPDVYEQPRPLAPGERLLLCSDGLHGMLDDRAIESVAAGRPIADAAHDLVRAANDAGGADNIAVVVGGVLARGEHLVPSGSAPDDETIVERFVRPVHSARGDGPRPGKPAVIAAVAALAISLGAVAFAASLFGPTEGRLTSRSPSPAPSASHTAAIPTETTPPATVTPSASSNLSIPPGCSGPRKIKEGEQFGEIAVGCARAFTPLPQVPAFELELCEWVQDNNPGVGQSCETLRSGQDLVLPSEQWYQEYAARPLSTPTPTPLPATPVQPTATPTPATRAPSTNTPTPPSATQTSTATPATPTPPIATPTPTATPTAVPPTVRPAPSPRGPT